MASRRASPLIGRALFGPYNAGATRDVITAIQSMTIAINESVYIGADAASRFIGVPPVASRYLGKKTLT